MSDEKNSGRIYLDHAATTPLHPAVVRAMRDALDEPAFNPSSIHAHGRRARAQLDDLRDRAAAALDVDRRELVFTSGGTEADNLALFGALAARGDGARLVTTAIEHHAVLHAARDLAARGRRVDVLPVDRRGLVELEQFELAVAGPEPVAASVMMVNNEIGVVQPIAQLAAEARRRGAVFHTDAVQAAGWLELRPRELGVDLLSLSAHKLRGPKGIGLLYVRRGTAVSPRVVGGGQESGLRSGTENVLGILGFVTALELAVAQRAERAERVAALRDRFEKAVLAAVSGVRIAGDGAPRAPHIANLSFQGVDSESLLMRLDLDGLSASAGSACTSGTLEPSHVIAALGGEPAWQTGVVRFSLGEETTQAEIDRAAALVARTISALRATAATA